MQKKILYSLLCISYVLSAQDEMASPQFDNDQVLEEMSGENTSASTPPEEEASQAQPKAEEEPPLSVEEGMRWQAFAIQQIDTLQIIVQHVAHLASINALKHKNPGALQMWVNDIIMKLTAYKQFVQNQAATREALSNVFLLNERLITHVNTAVKHHFIRLEEFNFEEAIHRNQLIVITDELVSKTMNKNQLTLVQLQKTTQGLGISFINTFFKGIDSVLNLPLVKPVLKYSTYGFLGYIALQGYHKCAPDWLIDEVRISLIGRDGYPNDPRNLTCLKNKLPSIPNEVISGIAVKIASDGLMNLYTSKATYASHKINQISNLISLTFSQLKGENKKIDTSLSQLVEDITLDDPRLIGLADQKKSLEENIIEPLLKPELFFQNGIELERAVALIGPSRNGKTLIARALCGSINKRFKELGRNDRIRFRELTHMELNRYTLKTIIEDAQENGPMVLFIDEFHMRRPQTTTGNELVEYLTELETLYKTNDPRKMVFLVIATNRPDMMDPALFQHKRFGIVVRFEKPNNLQRQEFFLNKAQQCAVTLTEEEVMAFVGQTVNRSYGDLDQIFQEAKILSKHESSSLQSRHIQQVMNSFVHHITSKFPLSEQEQKTSAAHYAGHVTVHELLNHEERIELVTIRGINRVIKEKSDWIPDNKGNRQNPNNDKVYKTRYGKMVLFNPNEALQLKTVHTVEQECKRLLAGRIAEEIILGSPSLTYHAKDRQKALNLIKMIVLHGIDEKELSDPQRHELMAQASQKLALYEQEVRDLLVKRKEVVMRLYEQLLSQKTLFHHDIKKLMQ